MPTEGLETVSAGTDFSLIGLFFQADLVVKAVMLILLIASLWSWAVILEKWFSLGGANGKAKKFEEEFWSGNMDHYEGRPGQAPNNGGARVFAAASREWGEARRTEELTPAEAEAIIHRAERAMRAAVDREAASAEAGLGALATIASSSPFIGLFGTVWGIMNAFRDIGEKQDTSLAVVAPGIAEALFATALGLVAAIPALMFYNKLLGDAGKLTERLDTFSQDILVRLSRRASERVKH